MKLNNNNIFLLPVLLAGLSLQWLTNYPGYVLQTATTLANGGDWQDSTAIPTQTNGQNVVTMLTSGSAGFFRLCGP